MTGAGEPVVEFDDVTRTFGDITALADVSWTLRRGHVLGLLGHNGAGKTTALRLISGVLTASGGRVRVFGLDPTTHGAQVRRHVGVLLAAPPVDRRMTGRENLRFAARVHRLDRDEADLRIDELAVSFHIDDRLDERTDAYSDGMLQRLSLARMLLANPSLLLLDEPTSRLDPMAAHGVRELVGDLVEAQSRTVVLATHDLIEAAALCDTVAVLQHGRVVALGAPEELAQRIGARGLRLVTDQSVQVVVSTIATRRGYTVEPLDTGVVRLHGVEFDDVPAVVRDLVADDVPVYGVSIERPTLTDFYLTLHRDDAEIDALAAGSAAGEGSAEGPPAASTGGEAPVRRGATGEGSG